MNFPFPLSAFIGAFKDVIYTVLHLWLTNANWTQDKQATRDGERGNGKCIYVLLAWQVKHDHITRRYDDDQVCWHACWPLHRRGLRVPCHLGCIIYILHFAFCIFIWSSRYIGYVVQTLCNKCLLLKRHNLFSFCDHFSFFMGFGHMPPYRFHPCHGGTEAWKIEEEGERSF